jgi:hypothetical protein
MVKWFVPKIVVAGNVEQRKVVGIILDEKRQQWQWLATDPRGDRTPRQNAATVVAAAAAAVLVPYPFSSSPLPPPSAAPSPSAAPTYSSDQACTSSN